MQTDEPSFIKLRTAVRTEDVHEANKQWDGLRKTRSDVEIDKAMRRWAATPFTHGTRAQEAAFFDTLNP